FPVLPQLLVRFPAFGYVPYDSYMTSDCTLGTLDYRKGPLHRKNRSVFFLQLPFHPERSLFKGRVGQYPEFDEAFVRSVYHPDRLPDDFFFGNPEKVQKGMVDRNYIAVSVDHEDSV